MKTVVETVGEINSQVQVYKAFQGFSSLNDKMITQAIALCQIDSILSKY